MGNSEDGKFASVTSAYYDYSNYYMDNFLPFEACSYKTVTNFGSVAVPIFFTIVVLLSLIGNILVLVILGLCKNCKSLTNIFILNLALSDLIFTLGLLFQACSYIWSSTFGDFMCKGVNFVFSVGFCSSIVFLMLMSIQRYVAVVHPRSDWNNSQSFVVILILAWMFSFSAALPELLYSKVIADQTDFDATHYGCKFSGTKAVVGVIYYKTIFFVVSFSFIGFCFIRITRTILRSQTNNRHGIIKLIFCMVVVSFISWAPYNFVMFLRSLSFHQMMTCDEFIRFNYAIYICTVLAYSHCCLNPVLYGFFWCKIPKLFMNTSTENVLMLTRRGLENENDTN